MLFYRALTVVIMIFEIYYLTALNNSIADEGGNLSDSISLFAILLLWANLLFGISFLLLELILSRESPTLKNAKSSYPFTETPLKIALLYMVGISCPVQAFPYFTTLQSLIQLDLVFSYLSYAWKTFWPIIIVPVNKFLMQINAYILYVMRIIRGTFLYTYKFRKSYFAYFC